MKTQYILDTCAWLDFNLAPNLLSKEVKELISEASPLFIATMSMIEVSRKVSSGKLSISTPIGQWLELALPPDHIKNLSITRQIAIEAYSLPGSFHADPADRVIVATARVHNLTLLTSDKRIINYPYVLSLSSRS